MAKITRTDSGKYRTLEYYVDENGIKRRKSFTHEDKSTLKLMASEFLNGKGRYKNIENITLDDAVKRYITSKEGVLSENTIRGYQIIRRNCFKNIMQLPIRQLTNEIIQLEITKETLKHSPKYIANAYGLLSATIKLIAPDFTLKATLPSKVEFIPTVPVDEQIKAILKLSEGTPMELIIMLAAMGSLREGEIAALTVGDISDSGISINKNMVRTQNEKWKIKPSPKTEAGIRIAPLPPELIKKLRLYSKDKKIEDSIFSLNPGMIYKRFKTLCKKCGMDDCRFHDLRHYYASAAHFLGVPDKYIMLYGGWKDKGTLTKVYQKAQKDHVNQQSKKVTNFFSSMINDKDNETETNGNL